MKFLLLLLLFVSCTTVENDPTTASPRPFFSTRVDFEPPTREKRDQYIEIEKRTTDHKLALIQSRMDGLEAERGKLFSELESEFPECKNQSHCISELSKGSVRKFERYREINRIIGGIDVQLAELQNEFDLWKRRGELRERAIYNRYLVTQLLKVKGYHPNIENIIVHSLEAFPNRRELSQRLIQLTDPDLVPAVVGDLDFRMMGKPIDEAAILATFDVLLFSQGERKQERYLITFLINSFQLDPQFYEKEFLKGWSNRLSERDQSLLSREVYCGLFSISSDTLLPRLDSAKTKLCRSARDFHRTQKASNYLDRTKTESWLLPIHYVSASKRLKFQ
jgi:hypothetical protein